MEMSRKAFFLCLTAASMLGGACVLIDDALAEWDQYRNVSYAPCLAHRHESLCLQAQARMAAAPTGSVSATISP